MSLVVRVISEAVENLSNSAPENPTTFEKTSCLILCATPAAVLDEIRPTRIVAAAPARVSSSIYIPVVRIYLIRIAPVSTPSSS